MHIFDRLKLRAEVHPNYCVIKDTESKESMQIVSFSLEDWLIWMYMMNKNPLAEKLSISEFKSIYKEHRPKDLIKFLQEN